LKNHLVDEGGLEGIGFALILLENDKHFFARIVVAAHQVQVGPLFLDQRAPFKLSLLRANMK